MRRSRIPGRRLFRFPWRTAAQVAADVDEELRFHLDRVAEELVDAGWTPESARVEAVRRFGDLEGTRQFCCSLDRSKETQMKWMQALETLGQDLRFGARQLGKSPGFTFVALLTLALAVGASASIFSVVHGILLRPLPYSQPERVVRLYQPTPEGRVEGGNFSIPTFVDWRHASRTVTAAAAYRYGNLILAGDEAPERLIGMWAGADFFRVLGVRPLAGRWFAPDEEKAGAQRVAVVSEKLWQERFGRDPGLIGRTLRLNGEPRIVVGVMAQQDRYPDFVDVWLPLVFAEEESQDRGMIFLDALARLAPGATLEAARTEARVISGRLARQYQDSSAGLVIDMKPLQDVMVGDVRTPLLVLLGAVLFVLLIACANVANLQLVRASAREGEVAVRTALGAGPRRIVRQLLTENVVLALAGGAAGVALAVWATRALVAAAPEGTPRIEEVAVDGTVLLFALGITLATGLLFGLAPALQASRPNLAAMLKEGARGSRGRASTRARNFLVVAEIALAVVLLAGAGLLLRSFAQLQKVDLGFQPAGVLKFHLSPPQTKYPGDTELRLLTDRLLDELDQLPGVTAAGATIWGMPLVSGENVLGFSIQGRPPKPPGQDDSIRFAMVSPGFFRTLGIPVVRGRYLTALDREGAPPVLLINQAAAREYFPGEDPLGKRILFSSVRRSNMNGAEIVGIVGDFKQSALEDEVAPQAFLSMAQTQLPRSTLVIALKTEADPGTVVAGVRTRMREIDPDLPAYAVKTMDEIVTASAAQPRFYMLLLGGFAFVALVLAAVGIYGVIAYAVRERTQEIGIRMALGATRERVLRMVVRQGMTLALAGAAAGLVGALVATRWMQSLLYQVSAMDPTIYLTVAALLVTVAAVASWLPARRAAGTEPLLALRGQ